MLKASSFIIPKVNKICLHKVVSAHQQSRQVLTDRKRQVNDDDTRKSVVKQTINLTVHSTTEIILFMNGNKTV